MSALVDDYEIEARAYVDTGPVPPQVSIDESVAVCDRTLMLHAGVRHFHQLVPIPWEGISTEAVIEANKEEMRVRLANVQAQSQMKLARNLMKIQQEINAEAKPEKIKKQLEKMLAGLVPEVK